ncbi:MAG: DUF6771 family protein [Pseudomonadota bacterium]
MLANVLQLFPFSLMSRIDETAIATILLRAPGWARVGLTVSDERLREAAAGELARVIVDEMDERFPEPFNPDQLAFKI